MKYIHINKAGLPISVVVLLIACGSFHPVTGESAPHKKGETTVADTVAVPGKTLGKKIELTTVAYGSFPKEEIISSVSGLSGAYIEKNSVFSLGNALYGRIPGLVVQQTLGEPESDSPTFTIRGKGTFGISNNPLVIVDGFERDMNTLPVEDIESISVLKDASATVLYGGRAANGVIIVTTKRGYEGKNRIAVNIQQGIQTPTRLPDFVSSAQYARMYNQALAGDGLASRFSEEDIQGFDTSDPLYYPNVNWMDETIRKKTFATNVNTSISGGNKIGRYYVSLGFIHNNGLYKDTKQSDSYSTNNNLDRFNCRSNLDINVLDELKISLDLGGQINMKNAPVASATDIWKNLYTYPTYIPVYTEDGVLGGTSAYPNNPVGYINEMGYSKNNDRFFQTSLKMDYDMSKLLEGLAAKAAFGYDNYYSVKDSWKKTFLVKELLGKDATTGKPVLSDDIGKNTFLEYVSPNSDIQSRRYSFNVQLDYNRSFNELHNLDVALIYHQDRLTLGTENPYNNQSVGGRIHYNIKKKYLVELAASYSGTEAFAENYRFGFFPAVSAGWIVSDESFLKENPLITHLKLRTSAGMVGNDDVGERFSYRQLYTTGAGYNMGSSNGGLPGLVESTIANRRMTFEKSYQYEVGIDACLWDALDVSASWFKQHRTGILTSQSSTTPDFFGGILPSVNTGKANIQGFDIALNLQKEKEKWGYRIGLNISYAKSKVLYMDEAFLPSDSEYGYRKGHPVSQPFGLVALGLFQSQEEIEDSPTQQFGTVRPGDIKYKDMNNDRVINDYDIAPIGKSSFPETELGLILGGHFKGFDLQAVFQSQLGRDIYLGNAPKIFWALKDNANISTYAQNAWSEETKTTADYPRLSTMDNTNNFRASSFWYKSGNFLKLRSLEVGYNFPKSVTSSLKMGQLRLFARGMNLLTFNKLKEVDPELISGYPALQSYYLGLKVQF